MTRSIIVKKKFDYSGIELRIVDRQEKFMNSKDLVTVRRVLAPNNKNVPIIIQNKETFKSIMERTINIIEGFKVRGANVIEELTN